MHAVRLFGSGAPEVVAFVETQRPEPGAGEVLIRVLAATLTPEDVDHRRGLPDRLFGAPPPPVPFQLGRAGVGQVVGLGPEAVGWAVGERVAVAPFLPCGECLNCRDPDRGPCLEMRFLGRDVFGTQAEYVAIPAAALLAAPTEVAAEDLACAVEALPAAWHAVIVRGRLARGRSVLVLGAERRSGAAALAVASAIGASPIIAVAGDGSTAASEHADRVVRLDDRLTPAVRELSDGGVDLVVDCRGADAEPVDPSLVLGDGVVVLIGRGGRADAAPLPGPALSVVDLRGNGAATMGDLGAVAEMVAGGELKASPSAVMDLRETQEAQRLLESGEIDGTVVLVP